MSCKKTISKISLAVLITLYCQFAIAKPFQLLCKMEQTKWDNGAIPSTDEVFLTINEFKEGNVLIEKVGLQQPLEGVISSTVIIGKVDYQLPDGITVHETIKLNRYSGEYQGILTIGKFARMQSGYCQLIEKRLF